MRPVIEINDSMSACAYWNTNFMESSTHVSTGINIKHQWNFGRLCFLLYKDKQSAYAKYVFKFL